MRVILGVDYDTEQEFRESLGLQDNEDLDYEGEDVLNDLTCILQKYELDLVTLLEYEEGDGELNPEEEDLVISLHSLFEQISGMLNKLNLYHLATNEQLYLDSVWYTITGCLCVFRTTSTFILEEV